MKPSGSVFIPGGFWEMEGGVGRGVQEGLVVVESLVSMGVLGQEIWGEVGFQGAKADLP